MKVKGLVLVFMLLIVLNLSYGLQCHEQITSGNVTNDTGLYYIYDDFDDGTVNTSYWENRNIVEQQGLLNVTSLDGDVWSGSYGTNIASQPNGSLPTNITIEIRYRLNGSNQNYHIISFQDTNCTNANNAVGCRFSATAGVVKRNNDDDDDLINEEWSGSTTNWVTGGATIDNTYFKYHVFINKSTQLCMYDENGTFIACKDSNQLSVEGIYEGYFGGATPFHNTNLLIDYILVYNGTVCPEAKAEPVPSRMNVSLSYPYNNTYNNSLTNSLCYLPVFNGTPQACKLYTNYSGLWEVNKTDSTVTNYTENCFSLTVPDNMHLLWNVECNITTGGSNSSVINNTFKIDTVAPVITVAQPINNSLHGNTLDISASCTDDTVYILNYTLFDDTGAVINSLQNTTLSGTYLFLNTTLDVSGNGTQDLTLNVSCSDGHTLTSWSSKTEPKYINDGLDIDDIKIVVDKVEGGDLLSITPIKKSDRYLFDIKFTNTISSFQYVITADEIIKYYSDYKGHLIIKSGASRYWFDTEPYTPKSIIIKDNVATITIDDILTNKVITRSIGGLNVLTMYYNVSIDTGAPVIENLQVTTNPVNFETINFNFTINENNPDSYIIAWNYSGAYVNGTAKAYTNGAVNAEFRQPNVTGAYCFRVWANDSFGNINTSDVCFNTEPFFLLNVTYGNYTTETLNYVRILNYTVYYKCGATTTNISRLINYSNEAFMSLPCDYTTHSLNGYYKHVNEENYTINFMINNSEKINYSTNWTFQSDLYNPVIVSLNLSFREGFYSNATNITLICNDSIFSPLFINFTFNDVNYYYDNATKLLNITNASSVGRGTNVLSVTCGDLFGNTTVTKHIEAYPVALYLINEKTKALFNCSNATKCGFYYLNESYYDFKLVANMSPVNFTALTDTKLRFEIQYASGTIINYYIDVSLINNTRVRVCANTDDATFYEQIMYSAVSKQALLKNVYADCYVGADYTRFGYGNAMMLRGFTISAEYVLYTYDGVNLISLSGIDGGKEQTINLDTLEFNLEGYDFSVLGESLVFQKNGTYQIKIYYKNMAQDNTATALEIVNMDTNAVVYTESAFSNPNEFTTYYNFGGTTYDNATIWRATLTNTKTDGTRETIKRYFNIFGQSGMFNNTLAVVIVVLLLFFGLTFLVASLSFSWLGFFLHIISLIILSLAVGAWYITFLQAVVAVFMLFTLLTMFNKYYPQVS